MNWTDWNGTDGEISITARDSAMILLKYQDYHSGDNFQYYNPNAVSHELEPYGITNAPVIRTNFNFDEYQKPLAVFRDIITNGGPERTPCFGRPT